MAAPPSLAAATAAAAALLLWASPILQASVLTEMEKPVPIRDVVSVLGGSAELPCDILPEDAHDDVYLVLWFKDAATKPMYSLDVRGKPLSEANHWAESSSIGKRSSFRTNQSPNSLVVENLNLKDEGIYRCRVDYRNSPTKNVKLNLTIIVPPSPPTISNADGQELPSRQVGPYEIDDDLVLDCHVRGGFPLPKVTWWKGSALYDSTDEVLRPASPVDKTVPGTGLVVNRMVYRGLQRADLGTTYQCQATNTNLTTPVVREAEVVLNLKPTSLAILAKPSFVSANKQLEAVCQAVGGFPPPKLTWWLGAKKKRSHDEASYSGVSKSVLRFTPTIEDDGRYLTCRAENMALHNTVMEDQWDLQVHYAPIVSLRLGRNLDADNLRTGHDVYFECHVRSNPPPLRLEWMRNGEMLYADQENGVIMSTQSLVLQHVTKSAVGDYVCRAVNTEGTGESNAVPLKIMYPPSCDTPEVDRIVGVSPEESAAIRCKVDAYPPVVTYTWHFNNSVEQSSGGSGREMALDHDRFTADGLVSTLEFSPTAGSSKDYGSLYCAGENIIGRQAEPCQFTIVPTGRPSPLTDCHITSNATKPPTEVADPAVAPLQPSSSSSSPSFSGVRIACSEGFDGGLPQTFLLEVYAGDELKTKVTNLRPHFEVTNVNPESGGIDDVKLFVFAENAMGTSEPFILEENNFRHLKHSKHAVEGVTDSKAVTGSKSTESGSMFASPSSSVVVIVTGVACGVVFTVLIVCLLVTCRKRRIPSSPPSQNSPNIDQRGGAKGSNGRSRSSSSSSGGLREAAQQRYVSQEKVVNPGEGGGRGAVVYGADQQMVLHQHQAKNYPYETNLLQDGSIVGVMGSSNPLLAGEQQMALAATTTVAISQQQQRSRSNKSSSRATNTLPHHQQTSLPRGGSGSTTSSTFGYPAPVVQQPEHLHAGGQWHQSLPRNNSNGAAARLRQIEQSFHIAAEDPMPAALPCPPMFQSGSSKKKVTIVEDKNTESCV